MFYLMVAPAAPGPNLPARLRGEFPRTAPAVPHLLNSCSNYPLHLTHSLFSLHVWNTRDRAFGIDSEGIQTGFDFAAGWINCTVRNDTSPDVLMNPNGI